MSDIELRLIELLTLELGDWAPEDRARALRILQHEPPTVQRIAAYLCGRFRVSTDPRAGEP